MHRRLFSKMMALGAGSLGSWHVAAAADAPAADRGAAAPPETLRAEPVNVADFQKLAQARLPQAVYEYIASGSTDEVTLAENIAAFQRLRILPPLLTGVAQADTTTTILKQTIALPILLAPVAAQNLYHSDGVLASVRAAATAQTIMGVSSSAGHSIEEVAAASAGPKWFQLYVPKDRGLTRRLVERVERAGYRAIVVTVDLGERKDSDRRNRFALPFEILRTNLRNAGFEIDDRQNYDDLLKFNDQAWDLALSWTFFDWLKSHTKLPVVIKGVLRPDDANRAVAAGVDGIIVSNHGGRRLDGVPASIEQLPSIVEAADGRAEVLLDSGVRRGTDVLKALALGAKAVLIGRPYAWALAADGETGVARVLQLLHEELVSAMLATGCAKIGDINRSLLR